MTSATHGHSSSKALNELLSVPSLSPTFSRIGRIDVCGAGRVVKGVNFASLTLLAQLHEIYDGTTVRPIRRLTTSMLR